MKCLLHRIVEFVNNLFWPTENKRRKREGRSMERKKYKKDELKKELANNLFWPVEKEEKNMKKWAKISRNSIRTEC